MVRALPAKRLVLALAAAASVAAAFWLDRIPQDPGYHQFADKSAWSGIPNFSNVATNLPFLIVGWFGFARRARLEIATQRVHYTLFCAGVALVGMGSAYYHWAPSNSALVWDRLPMTVAFMALFSAVIQDRVSERLGQALLWPLVVAGVASIGWWYWSELAGRGDLRPYAVVQFLPPLLMPLMLLMFKGRGLRGGWLWATLAAYLVAKVAEYFDAPIYSATGLLGGHAVKHLLGALAVWLAIRAFPVVKVTDLRPGHNQRSPARAL